MAPGSGNAEYDWHYWAREEWRKEAANKAAEALAEANTVGRHNFGALETRLKALEQECISQNAFYKGKFEEQERDHQELMAMADERLKKLETQERDHQELVALAVERSMEQQEMDHR